MAATIELRQRVTAQADGSFLVQQDVAAATSISTALFVFSVETSHFTRYASVRDIELLPIGRDLAVAQGMGYYRAVSMSRTWPTPSEAATDLSVSHTILLRLANDWSIYTADLQGLDRIVTIEAEEP